MRTEFEKFTKEEQEEIRLAIQFRYYCLIDDKAEVRERCESILQKLSE